MPSFLKDLWSNKKVLQDCKLPFSNLFSSFFNCGKIQFTNILKFYNGSMKKAEAEAFFSSRPNPGSFILWTYKYGPNLGVLFVSWLSSKGKVKHAAIMREPVRSLYFNTTEEKCFNNIGQLAAYLINMKQITGKYTDKKKQKLTIISQMIKEEKQKTIEQQDTLELEESVTVLPKKPQNSASDVTTQIFSTNNQNTQRFDEDEVDIIMPDISEVLIEEFSSNGHKEPIPTQLEQGLDQLEAQLEELNGYVDQEGNHKIDLRELDGLDGDKNGGEGLRGTQAFLNNLDDIILNSSSPTPPPRNDKPLITTAATSSSVLDELDELIHTPEYKKQNQISENPKKQTTPITHKQITPVNKTGSTNSSPIASKNAINSPSLTKSKPQAKKVEEDDLFGDIDDDALLEEELLAEINSKEKPRESFNVDQLVDGFLNGEITTESITRESIQAETKDSTLDQELDKLLGF